MKITDVKVHVVEWERPGYFWRDGIMPGKPKGRSGLMRILTDEGVEGMAPCRGGISIDEVKFQLIGRDPLNREEIWQAFWKNLRSSNLGFAIGSVDCALWDLLGQMSGLPVYKLLGAVRDEVPTYASTFTVETLADYMELAQGCLDRGYRAIKLHAWGRLDEDAELIKALRSLTGDDVELMYDASSGFPLYEDAVWFGRRLEEQRFFWYEEPMDHFNMTVLARLAAELDIPLAVAEATHGGPWDALAQIRAGAADVILTGPTDAFKGGFTGVLKTGHICEGYGIMCAMHGGSIASLHAACALSNTKYFERLIPEDFHTPPGIQDASSQIENGMARPWNEPGLGIHVDWDWVKAHQVAELG
jgi:L-alanine-DL-glutamate epimerase-like enolase superfamily enzyme